MTGLTAAILGVAAAWVAIPIVRDLQIIDMLGDEDPLRRERGILLAVSVAEDRPQLIERIENGLDPAGDVQFSAMVNVLNRLGKFRTPARKGEQLDRFYLVKFISCISDDNDRVVDARGVFLHRLILDGRDNVHVRKALRLAADDPADEIRSTAALLACRLGDDKTLAELLGDDKPQVRASAALDAGLAGRKTCTNAIAKILEKPQTDDEHAAAAYALARLKPEKFAPQIAQAILSAHKTGKIALLDKLLHVASLLDINTVGPAVIEVLKDSQRRGQSAPTSALIAAGRLEIHEAKPFIQATINQLISRREKLTGGDTITLAAAVNAAGRLKLPPKIFVEVMEKLWHPRTSVAMILASEAIANRREIIAKDPKLRSRTLTVLVREAERSDTPVPSAAAATALLKLAGQRADESLLAACESETYLAGDYVAWNLAQSRTDDARRIGGVFFGPGIYNKTVRANATILLALLERGTDKADGLAEIIESRLIGLNDQFTAGSYHCAMLILNQREYIDKVAALTEYGSFGQRRVLTALALAGAATGFDRVFAGAKFNPARIDSYLAGRLMSRVYSSVVPEMPAFDPDATPETRHWQCRIQRDYYLIHRKKILGKIQP